MLTIIIMATDMLLDGTIRHVSRGWQLHVFKCMHVMLMSRLSNICYSCHGFVAPESVQAWFCGSIMRRSYAFASVAESRRMS